jgi:signal peptidase I
VRAVAESLLWAVALTAAAWTAAWLTRAFLLSVHVVRSASMEPTLRVGDRICAVRRPWRRIAGGDVVIARVSGTTAGSEREVVKRVAWTRGEEGRAPRPRLLSGRQAHDDRPQLFVVGDNAAVSRDSRHYGPIAADRLVALAVCVVWPPRRARSLLTGTGHGVDDR